MSQTVLNLLDELRAQPHETEWLEFKGSYYDPEELGQYLSALANSAAVHDREKGYLVFGVDDATHQVVGTTFSPKTKKIGNQPLEMWLNQMLSPRPHSVIHEFEVTGRKTVLFEIAAARNIPVAFKHVRYVRVGSSKTLLREHPDKERIIFNRFGENDWSAEVCPKATINDLDPKAIMEARRRFAEKHKSDPDLLEDLEDWDDATFLGKCGATLDGRITRAALLLLGRPEAAHYLRPAVARITWILKDATDVEIDYAHFDPPFLLRVDTIFAKVRNLTHRYLPDGTLFPVEVTQYAPWVMREALHNCIAHQDYRLQERIVVVERPDELVFANAGVFLPGSVEEVIERDAPWRRYQNPALADLMVNLGMIDTIGSGIKRMFRKQRERNFPLPDYDLARSTEVLVRLPGQILDANYTRLLIEKEDLSLRVVMLLDRVQKGKPVTRDEAKLLRRQKLAEGRYPNLHVSARVAAAAEARADYIRTRGLDDAYYQQLIIEYLRKYGSATRKDIDRLVLEKLPDVLSAKQKAYKIARLLSHQMCQQHGWIANLGSRRKPEWVLTEAGRNIGKRK